jgi:hypothetical protein
MDILYVQGIDSKMGAGGGNYVLFCTKDKRPDEHTFGFLVKNWSFASTQSSGDPEFPFLNMPFAGKSTETGNIGV